MVGVHPKEDKPGFQVELAEHSGGRVFSPRKTCSSISPPSVEGRLVNLLFYYSLSFPHFAQCCGSRSFPNRLPRLDTTRNLFLCPNSNLNIIMIYRYIRRLYPSSRYIVYIKLIGLDETLVETRIGINFVRREEKLKRDR